MEIKEVYQEEMYKDLLNAFNHQAEILNKYGTPIKIYENAEGAWTFESDRNKLMISHKEGLTIIDSYRMFLQTFISHNGYPKTFEYVENQGWNEKRFGVLDVASLPVVDSELFAGWMFKSFISSIMNVCVGKFKETELGGDLDIKITYSGVPFERSFTLRFDHDALRIRDGWELEKIFDSTGLMSDVLELTLKKDSGINENSGVIVIGQVGLTTLVC